MSNITISSQTASIVTAKCNADTGLSQTLAERCMKLAQLVVDAVSAPFKLIGKYQLNSKLEKHIQDANKNLI